MRRNAESSRGVLPRMRLQVCADARKKDEDRRAEMRDPARHEDGERRVREIGRVVVQGGTVHEIARVVDDHDDHHDAAQEVDRVEPRPDGNGGLNGVRRGDTRHGPRILP